MNGNLTMAIVLQLKGHGLDKTGNGFVFLLDIPSISTLSASSFPVSGTSTFISSASVSCGNSSNSGLAATQMIAMARANSLKAFESMVAFKMDYKLNKIDYQHY